MLPKSTFDRKNTMFSRRGKTPQKHDVFTWFQTRKKHRENTCVLNAFSKYAEKARCFSHRVAKKCGKRACFYVFSCYARGNTRRFDIFGHSEALKARRTRRFRKAHFRKHVKKHEIVKINARIVKNTRFLTAQGREPRKRPRFSKN